MKAEINKENKAKFFAQHWSQDVMIDTISGRNNSTTQIIGFQSFPSKDSIDEYFLLLTSLSAITDEDAIEWAKIIDPSKIYGDHSNILEFKECFATDLLDPDNLLDGGMSMVSSYESLDYLRSKGYALPWRGLSVKEMIRAGWVRLRKQS